MQASLLALEWAMQSGVSVAFPLALFIVWIGYLLFGLDPTPVESQHETPRDPR